MSQSNLSNLDHCGVAWRGVVGAFLFPLEIALARLDSDVVAARHLDFWFSNGIYAFKDMYLLMHGAKGCLHQYAGCTLNLPKKKPNNLDTR